MAIGVRGFDVVFDAVLFDFDGVILQSVDIKTNAFRKLFSDYPQHIPAIIEYHLNNLSISRFIKFEWVYRNVLKKEFTEAECRRLGEEFSRIVYGDLLACPFVAGARESLDFIAGKCRAYIVSGTPHDELTRLVADRSLSGVFAGVFGSPPGKADIIRSILTADQIPPQRAVFIGDAKNDYDAAKARGVAFVAVAPAGATAQWEARAVPCVKDLREIFFV